MTRYDAAGPDDDIDPCNFWNLLFRATWATQSHEPYRVVSFDPYDFDVVDVITSEAAEAARTCILHEETDKMVFDVSNVATLEHLGVHNQYGT